MALLVTLVIGARIGERKVTAQDRKGAVQAPMFEVDPLWPKPLPNHWVLGSLGGIAVDGQDHIKWARGTLDWSAAAAPIVHRNSRAMDAAAVPRACTRRISWTW